MLLDFHLFHAYICTVSYSNINYRGLAKTHEQKIRSILLDIISYSLDISCESSAKQMIHMNVKTFL